VVDVDWAGAGGAVAGVVLAAGAGTRLRPLTEVRPKALCPVADRPLVDLALDRLAAVTPEVAVNVHHGREALEEHLAGRAHVSIEEAEPLGTAGALGRLREWIAGRPVLVVNGDAWTDAPVTTLLDGWDGERTRLLVAGAIDHRRPSLAGAVMPWSAVAGLRPEPSGLWELRWSSAEAEGRLEWLTVRARFADCGTPGSYLAANLAASHGAPVIGAGARVAGALVRSVVWPGCEVLAGERLWQAIRYAEGRTVLVR
jgi:mannose-1-phosphate guanylyltransferase/MurNAc alpha-1-phosphate uridylyltransferase